MLTDESYDGDALSTKEIGRYLRTDYFDLGGELTEPERDHPRRSRTFVDDVLSREMLAGRHEFAKFLAAAASATKAVG